MDHAQLYGRLNETNLLRKALDAATATVDRPHLVILTGKAGAGKRALAESLRPIVESPAGGGGLFLSGRCRPNSEDEGGTDAQEQRQHVRPSVAFCEVIEDLVDSSNEATKQALRNVVASSQLFTPTELESLSEILASVDRLLRFDGTSVSTTTTRSSLSSHQPAFVRGISSAQERCRLLARFIRAASTCVPLVLHLHQAQRADVASIQLLQCLLQDDVDFRAATKGLLIVASIQDDDGAVVPTPIASLLQAIEEAKHNAVERIHVSSITRNDVHQWTVDRLAMEPGRDFPDATFNAITDLIFQHSSGNPQFVRYLLGYLEHGLAEADEEEDVALKLDELRQQIPARIDDMFKLVVQQQEPVVQRLVETVAAIKECGGVVDCPLVELILSQSCVQPLSTAQECGILELVHERIRFSLPESQVTAYSLIPESHRASVHLNIGRTISKQSSLFDDEIAGNNTYAGKWLNIMACQLRRGIAGVTSDELSAVATITFKAGKRAMQSSDFSAAASHFDFALSILGNDQWKTDNYDLCLALHNCGAEAYYCIGDFANMDRLLAGVFDNAATFQDKLQAYTAQVYTNGARHRLKEAVQTALDVLKQLGEPIPLKPSKLHVAVDYFKIRRMFQGKTDRFFLSLPNATDAKKIAAMQMLNFLCVYSYVSKPELGVLAVFRILRLAVAGNFTAPAIPAFAAYGYILCFHLGRYEEGGRFGRIALDMLNQCDAKAWLPRIYFYVYGLTNRWVKPFRDSLEPLLLAHKSALSTGDFEGGILTASTYVISLFYAGKPVPFMEKETRSFCQTIDALDQTLGLLFVVPRWTFFCDLAGDTILPLELSGEVTDGSSAFNVATRDGNMLALCMWHINHVTFRCLCGDYEASLVSTQKAKDAYVLADFGLIFYSGIAAMARARETKGKARRSYMAMGRASAKQFSSWARICPENYLNNQQLLEAELAGIEGKWEKAETLFAASIQAAKNEGFLHEEGLAYDRLGQYRLARNEKQSAVECFERARDTYKQWGAEALVRRMEARLESLSLAKHAPEQMPSGN